MNLYLRVHDFLKEADSYREAEEFLNYASGRLAQFIEITSSNSFLVAQGPECIRQVVCNELEEQDVTFNVTLTDMAPNRQLLVRLEESYFLCAAAFAEFEE